LLPQRAHEAIVCECSPNGAVRQPYTDEVERSETEQHIRELYRAMFRAWGRQHWWPARTRFEVIVGAFLTQNTAWTNVARALGNLRRARVLNLAGVRSLPIAQLEALVRPAGYFRQKAARLKRFVAFLDADYSGSLDRMFARPTEALRSELLALNGIGPETADAILLYAGDHPAFVVDAYARRILSRHGIVTESTAYDDVRRWVENALGDEPVVEIERQAEHRPSRRSGKERSPAAQHLNEMHGLLVRVGKLHCRKAAPSCESCPLQHLLPSGGPVLPSDRITRL
jgi:endonuclease-3 related protein